MVTKVVLAGQGSTAKNENTITTATAKPSKNTFFIPILLIREKVDLALPPSLKI
jgi:hypothetical protein